MAELGFRDVIRNTTASFIPSPMEFLMTVPRLAQRAGAFAFFYLPEQLDGLLSKTTSNKSIVSSATTAFGSSFTSSASFTATQAMETGQADGIYAFGQSLFSNIRNRTVLYKISNLDGVFSYMASRWAISTFAIAIILNRTQVYGSSRRRLELNWQSRFILRIVPIVIFWFQILFILQTLRCQTSSELSTARIKDSDQILFGAFTGEGGFLYKLSSTLLFWLDDRGSCLAAGMLPKGDDWMDFSGSLALLWPLFLNICLSHFVENLSCALEGRTPLAETGITIFEHSLAFAEAEAIVKGSVGMGLFGFPTFPTSAGSSSSPVATPDPSTAVTVTGAMVMQRLNLPPEVLLISLLSSCSHLSNNVLALLGLQAKCRLVNTGIWGISYMSAFFWSFVKFSRSAISKEDVIGVLRYPTICIVGYLPHFLILVGMTICAFVYLIALIITVISPPSKQHGRGTFRERIQRAHSNLQANVSLSEIKLKWQEEFFTQLLKIGYVVLTAASEAIYFNEGTTVTMNRWTWLEAQRFEEFSSKRQTAKRVRAMIPTILQGDSTIAEGIGLIEEDRPNFQDGAEISSGFARERKTTKTPSNMHAAATRENGVGESQRSGRWMMSFGYFKEAPLLAVRFSASLTHHFLDKTGIYKSPDWLQRLCLRDAAKESAQALLVQGTQSQKPIDFWMLSENGVLSRPSNLQVDVEAETRRRFRREEGPNMTSDDALESHLYDWWKSGGWWGELDSSGDYELHDVDDDTTSIISASSAASNGGDDLRNWEDEDEEDGRRTPTQERPYFGRGESVEPEDGAENLSHLAALLDPKTLEHKQQAKILASHLQNTGPMTRLRYRKKVEFERARVLSPQTQLPAAPHRLTAEEEEELLEQIILSRRHTGLAASQGHSSATWDEGAEGMGAGGPQCVVCHSSPRTILVWPCRCLSLCEECRVSLAMNNFGSCVCCRRDVVAFSRLFVP